MSVAKKILRIIGFTLLVLILSIGALVGYVWTIKAPPEPQINAIGKEQNIMLNMQADTSGFLTTIGDNWYRRNSYGLYELYVSGKPYELGRKNGLMSRQQIINQEIAFTDQLAQMIPGNSYQKFLLHIIRLMNKNLSGFVQDEYKQEILGISQSASDSFSWIGNKYERILNYHAAHDIGHALQNLMLVGCTSFAAWDSSTYNGSLLVGRNFDFWVGDKFSEEKIIAFYKPEKGHAFMFVTWGGFTGVVSGMNDKGLTVTINAAKSAIPWGGAATPVSLVAREVLQYAGNIDEAVAIARKRKMFVSESFLVASAADHKAITIEKTPDTLALYETTTDHILCTNHYQSKSLSMQQLNEEQKANSASVYRYNRLNELVTSSGRLSPAKVASILRDRKGMANADIGNGNEKAINQLIAHHSIIFQPDSLKVWVSTTPWNLGPYLCYDLRKVFSLQGLKKNEEVALTNETIPADTFVTHDLNRFLAFRKEKMKFLQHQEIDTAKLIYNNANYYDAWRIAGDYALQKEWRKAAARFYARALQCEIATQAERESISTKLKKLTAN